MGWMFWKKPVHPLDAAGLRPIEELASKGDLKAAAAALKDARATKGDVPGLRYLECRIYHDASRADAGELLAHLADALEGPAGASFIEARLLRVELLAARGQFDEAAGELNLIARQKLKGAPAARLASLAAELERWRGARGLAELRSKAESFAAELQRRDLVVRWRGSDFARLDGLLDRSPEVAEQDPEGFDAFVGELACRAGDGHWRLALRPQDRAVRLGNSEWRVGTAARSRLSERAALYAAYQRARGATFTAIPGIVGVEAHIEPGAHLAVAVDHVARALLTGEATGLGVFRERPTPEGSVLLPVSFIDKGGELRVLYIETRAWDGDRLSELRRWLARVRASVTRTAQVSLLSAYPPPQSALDLVEGRAEIPPVPSILSDARKQGARSATPRSLDEPKLDWLDQKAEMMERLVAAAVGAMAPTDLEVVKKIQSTVIGSFRPLAGEFSPKQWNALYGYGALYGRILARSFGGRWAGLGDDRPPAEWEMHFPWGRVSHPIGVILDLVVSGGSDSALVGDFLDVKAEADV